MMTLVLCRPLVYFFCGGGDGVFRRSVTVLFRCHDTKTIVRGVTVVFGPQGDSFPGERGRIQKDLHTVPPPRPVITCTPTNLTRRTTNLAPPPPPPPPP